MKSNSKDVMVKWQAFITRHNSTSEDRLRGEDPFTNYQFADPEKLAGLVSPEHVERHRQSNSIHPDCESGELTTTLSRPKLRKRFLLAPSTT